MFLFTFCVGVHHMRQLAIRLSNQSTWDKKRHNLRTKAFLINICSFSYYNCFCRLVEESNVSIPNNIPNSRTKQLILPITFSSYNITFSPCVMTMELRDCMKLFLYPSDFFSLMATRSTIELWILIFFCISILIRINFTQFTE